MSGRRANVRYFVILLALIYAACGGEGFAAGPAAAKAAAPLVIRVGVLNNPPYAFAGDHGLAGISVTAFNIIAARNHWKPEFILEDTKDELTNAIITRQIDIGIGGITPTPELGLVVDFSDANQIVPLALLVKDENTQARLLHIAEETGRVLFSVEMLVLLAIGIAAALLGGWLIRRIEQGGPPEMFPPEFRHNAWWAAQTLVAHNCGNKLPYSERGRYIAIVLMLGGTVFTAEVTAVMTTSLGASLRATAPIAGIGDIGARMIATVDDSYAESWLQQQLVNTRSYKTAGACVRALEQGQVSGVVYDEVALRRVLASGRFKDLKMVGDSFGSHPHAFMVGKRSPYLTALNASLDSLVSSKEWQVLMTRWTMGGA